MSFQTAIGPGIFKVASRINARRGAKSYFIALGLGLLTATPSSVRADNERVAVLWVGQSHGAPEGRRSLFRARVKATARARGRVVVEDPEAWVLARLGRQSGVSRDRVSAFSEIEELLVQARGFVAGLREKEALAVLVRASALARGHADVPGAAAWIAEVETALGIAAAQAGLDALAGSALARAASLDPTRGVRAADAPPDVAQRAAAIGRAVATRPTGSFPLRANVPGAKVFLDDKGLGGAPLVVRSPAGLHVVRVEAPGHMPWGGVIEVLEGPRPRVDIRLDPDPRIAEARRLVRAAEQPRVRGVVQSAQGLGLAAVWLVEVGRGSQDRALVSVCRRRGCGEPVRLELGDSMAPHLSKPKWIPADRFELAYRDGQAWLGAEEVARGHSPLPWWQRWYVWLGAGMLAAGAAAAAVAIRPDAELQDTLVIDPGEWRPETSAVP